MLQQLLWFCGQFDELVLDVLRIACSNKRAGMAGAKRTSKHLQQQQQGVMMWYSNRALVHPADHACTLPCTALQQHWQARYL
jgi:hypothetical protein